MTIISNKFVFKLKLFSIEFVEENKAGEVIGILIISFKECIIASGNELYEGVIF